VELILQQSFTYSTEVLMSQFAAKQQAISTRNQLLTDLFDALSTSLLPKIQYSILLSREKGSCS